MSDSRRCPDCGGAIPADAPAGQCPRCLVQAGFESQGDPPYAAGRTSANPSTGGFEAPSVEHVAAAFPQLEVLELVGKGGMGAVYKARHPGLDRLVAIKVLPPEVGRDPSFAERFSREARALARLGHPNIVAVHDFGQAGGMYYFVMEYIDGANLRQAIQAGHLKPEEALAIVPQICDALQYAHDEGVVHRDIKPENILLDAKGRVKIADFGLSKLLREEREDVSLTGTHQVMGTLRYMAPEQMHGSKTVDHRADIYSLGVVFYELLTGDVPAGRFDPPSQRVHIDVRLDEVVLRALAQEPSKRYQRASEVKTDVDAIRGVSPATMAFMRQAMGWEYKSRATLFGLPLVHVATGFDPATGRKRIAKGIVAAGDIAIGVFAAGGMALGGVALGGMSIGVVSMGGCALGLLLAIGGLAVGGTAFGGLGVGLVALGGGAVGYYALGGAAWGGYVFSGAQRDPEAVAFFSGWAEYWPVWLAGVGIVVAAMNIVVAVVTWQARRSGAAPDADDSRLRHDSPRDARGHSPGSGYAATEVGSRHHPAGERRDHGGGRLSARLGELAAVTVGLGIVVPILLFMFTGDLTLVRISLVVGQALGMGLGLLAFPAPLGRYAALVAVVVIGAYSAVQLFASHRGTPIVFPFFGDTGFVTGPDGPMLSDAKARQLGISAGQRAEADRIFQDYHRQYQKLERSHTTHTRGADGRVRITIAPFADEMYDLAKRLAAELGGVVDQRIAPPLPERGKLHTQLGLFRYCGEATVKVELWREERGTAGHTHFHKEDAEWLDGGKSNSGNSGWGVQAFPEQYRLYWSETDRARGE